MKKAYPTYDSQYRRHLDNVRAHIDQIPNLHTVGRNGMHKYNNQDHSMLTAMMAIWNMEGAAHDIWSVNTDFEYHEEQKLDEKPMGTASGGTNGTQPHSSGDQRKPEGRSGSTPYSARTLIRPSDAHRS
jgi:hypothetical protein